MFTGIPLNNFQSPNLSVLRSISLLTGDSGHVTTTSSFKKAGEDSSVSIVIATQVWDQNANP